MIGHLCTKSLPALPAAAQDDACFRLFAWGGMSSKSERGGRSVIAPTVGRLGLAFGIDFLFRGNRKLFGKIF